jgi:hypothetical protein
MQRNSSIGPIVFQISRAIRNAENVREKSVPDLSLPPSLRVWPVSSHSLLGHSTNRAARGYVQVVPKQIEHYADAVK